MARTQLSSQEPESPRYRGFAPEYGSVHVSEMTGGDRRLEAGTYLSDGFWVRRRILRSAVPIMRLEEVARVWQPGRDVGVQVGPEDGVPYLAATQVFDIWPTPRKRLGSGDDSELAELYLEPRTILVTCSGTVGRTILAYNAHVGLAVSSDLLRVEVADDPIMRSYVYAVMRSRFGRSMMEGTQYGSIIKHLRPSHLDALPIPMLSRSRRAAIHRKIKRAFDLRDEAYSLDMTARELFGSAMEDHPVIEREEGYSISAMRLFGQRRRLEAGAYSPMAQFVSQVYERNAAELETLGDVAQAFVPGRFKRIYGNEGTTYLDSEPIFKVNPPLLKRLTRATRIDFETYMVRRGWLLMACSGQIYGINGQAILANEGHERKIVTQHIMRIVPKGDRIRGGYLQTVLSHPVLGQPLVVSRAFGTSVPEIAPEDVERLRIPRLACGREDQIADAAERASLLRWRADGLEDSAVRMLETALAKELGEDELAGRKERGPAGEAGLSSAS